VTIFAATLESKLTNKTAHIGVIGLGYVGLPLWLAFGEAGITVTGFDIDVHKITTLKEGGAYLRQYPATRSQALLQQGHARVSAQWEELARPDVLIICVPTPLTLYREPDMRFVEATARTIVQFLRKGQLVILESTTYPGTTEEFLRPILEQSGLKSGEDFFLAFSPEREDPGNQASALQAIAKVVGGDGALACQLACLAYQPIVGRLVPVSSPQTAEAVKLTENIFRSVNIALINELKMTFEKMGIDIWEVVEAAATKPFGFMPFYPGPGVGGHCIPVDPYYLSWKARAYGEGTRFIELAGAVNAAMPDYVFMRVVHALNDVASKGIKGAKLLIIGVAYKKNIDDLRESPALILMQRLCERGALLSYHDPFIPEIGAEAHHPRLVGMTSVALSPDFLHSQDAVIIITQHDGIDYGAIAQYAPLVIDTRNIMRPWMGQSQGARIVMA
jgi:UDP-N-acetyl-D-glucosamine dehydrogenase